MAMSDTPAPDLDALLQHRSWVRAVARRLVLDEHEAADLEQDAWMAALRRPPDADRDPRPWLRRVLTNLASNRRRAAGRRTRREHDWREARSQRTPAEAVAETEQHGRLVGLVLELEEPFKTTLVLRFCEGFNPLEIAERLDIPVGTVHSRIHRALERIRSRLDEQEAGDRRAWVAGLLPLTGLESLGRAAPATAAASTNLIGVLLMSLTKSKIAFAAAVSLATLVAGGVWYALDLSADDPSTGPGEPELHTSSPPRLKGRADQLARPASDPSSGTAGSRVTAQPGVETWRGRVLDAQGDTVRGVRVFALPSGVAGLGQQEVEDPRYGLVRTDAEGAFALVLGDLERPRLVASAEGYLPASVELAGLRREDPVDLVLGDPWRITMRVEGPEGVWPDECEVYVWTNNDSLKHFAVDPKAARAIESWWRPESGGAERTVAVSTLAPVYVEPHPPAGFAAVPAWTRLEHPQAYASFRLVKTARITLRITDAETKERLPADVKVLASIRGADRDLQVDAEEAEGGVIVFGIQLSPRRYVVEVSAAGWTEQKVEVTVREPGQEIEMPVALERHNLDTEPMHVLFRVNEAGQVPDAVAALAAQAPKMYDNNTYRVLLRLAGTTTWINGDPKLLPDGRVELRTGRKADLRPGYGQGIKPGVYDVLVAQRKTGRAAFLPGVRIYEDRVNEFEASLEPGSLFRLNDLAGRDVSLTHVEVRSASVGALPLYTYRRSSGPQQIYTDAAGLKLLLRTPREPLILGPFPSEEVEVRITDAKGHVETHRVRGTP